MPEVNRAAQLLAMLGDAPDVREILRPTIKELVYLEGKLAELRELPFLRVNPANPAQQKVTPAAKQYKELLQQYNNCTKLVLVAVQRIPHSDSTPLADFLEQAHALLQ